MSNWPLACNNRVQNDKRRESYCANDWRNNNRGSVETLLEGYVSSFHCYVMRRPVVYLYLYPSIVHPTTIVRRSFHRRYFQRFPIDTIVATYSKKKKPHLPTKKRPSIDPAMHSAGKANVAKVPQRQHPQPRQAPELPRQAPHRPCREARREEAAGQSRQEGCAEGFQ
jgi:hypothetical protein